MVARAPIRPALRRIPTFWLTDGLHVLTLVLLVQNTFPERPARLMWFCRLAYLIRLGLRHCGMNVALAIQNLKTRPAKRSVEQAHRRLSAWPLL